MDGPIQLAELVCTRFSHDLSGLLGSLNGLLELVAEGQHDVPPEISLAAETAAEMMVRLRLLRAAWGGILDPMDISTLEKEMQRAAGNHELQLDLEAVSGTHVFPRGMARVVLNVVLLACEATPRGGVLTLAGDPSDGLVVQIAGPGAAWPPGFAMFIVDEALAWAALDDPRDLQTPLTALIAQAVGVRLSLMIPTGSSADFAIPPPLLIAEAKI
jgi:hypothetical protein